MNINLSALNDLKKFTHFGANAFEFGENNPDKVAQFEGGTFRSTTDKPGFIASIFRSNANKRINNETRTLFKDTIAKLFGGEANIPQEVKDAMHFNTFDKKGRPLTARRINETKNALADYLMKNKEALNFKLTGFQLGLVLTSGDTFDTVERYLKMNKQNEEEYGGNIGSINDGGNEEKAPTTNITQPKTGTGNTGNANRVTGQPKTGTGNDKDKVKTKTNNKPKSINNNTGVVTSDKDKKSVRDMIAQLNRKIENKKKH